MIYRIAVPILWAYIRICQWIRVNIHSAFTVQHPRGHGLGWAPRGGVLTQGSLDRVRIEPLQDGSDRGIGRRPPQRHHRKERVQARQMDLMKPWICRHDRAPATIATCEWRLPWRRRGSGSSDSRSISGSLSKAVTSHRYKLSPRRESPFHRSSHSELNSPEGGWHGPARVPLNIRGGKLKYLIVDPDWDHPRTETIDA